MTEWVAGSAIGISVSMGLDMRNGIGIRILLGSLWGQYHGSERAALDMFKPEGERSSMKNKAAGLTMQPIQYKGSYFHEKAEEGGGTATSTCHTPGTALEGINHRNRSSMPHPQHSSMQSVKCRDRNSRQIFSTPTARSAFIPAIQFSDATCFSLTTSPL